MGRYYILVDREPIEVDMMTWARAGHGRTEEDDPWRVAVSRFADGTTISTVFLGLDHQWAPNGPPLTFETMVFDSGEDEEWCERCGTWDEALIQHRAAVVWAVEQGHGQPVESRLFGVL